MKIMIPIISAFVLLSGCSPHKESQNAFIPLDRIKINEYVHPGYFKSLKFRAHLNIARKDDQGIVNYSGELCVDRSDTSKLVINEKVKFTMTYTQNSASFQSGQGKPINLDLSNPAHNVLHLREVSVIEPSPFRYLDSLYEFQINLANKDTTFILVTDTAPRKRIGQIKIYVQKATGYITDLFFYSAVGDMGRHVHYRQPLHIGGVLCPGEIIIDFAARATVVREHYKLENIVIDN